MMAGLEHARLVAKHFFSLIAGNLHERTVHMDDQPLTVSDQHPLTSAIEHRCCLTQTLAVLTAVAQRCVNSEKTQQSCTGNEDQSGTEHCPYIAVDQLPTGQIGRLIEEVVQ